MEARNEEKRRSVVASGKTVDDAIANGLEMLGVRRNQVDVEILSEGSRGVLGFGAENARVRLLVKLPARPTPVPAPPAPAPEPAAPIEPEPEPEERPEPHRQVLHGGGVGGLAAAVVRGVDERARSVHEHHQNDRDAPQGVYVTQPFLALARQCTTGYDAMS